MGWKVVKDQENSHMSALVDKDGIVQARGMPLLTANRIKKALKSDGWEEECQRINDFMDLESRVDDISERLDKAIEIIDRLADVVSKLIDKLEEANK